VGNILDMHREYLPDILEGDTSTGGDTVAVAISFTKGELTHTLTGWVNVVSNHIMATESADATALRSNVTVNLETISGLAGYPAAGWQNNMPTKGWIVNTANPVTGAPVQFVIEDGGTKFPDYHLGPITYFVTEYEEVTT